jgi:hypothetical protein
MLVILFLPGLSDVASPGIGDSAPPGIGGFALPWGARVTMNRMWSNDLLACCWLDSVHYAFENDPKRGEDLSVPSQVASAGCSLVRPIDSLLMFPLVE